MNDSSTTFSFDNAGLTLYGHTEDLQKLLAQAADLDPASALNLGNQFDHQLSMQLFPVPQGFEMLLLVRSDDAFILVAEGRITMEHLKTAAVVEGVVVLSGVLFAGAQRMVGIVPVEKVASRQASGELMVFMQRIPAAEVS